LKELENTEKRSQRKVLIAQDEGIEEKKALPKIGLSVRKADE
jgi:hypothetical protein